MLQRIMILAVFAVALLLSACLDNLLPPVNYVMSHMIKLEPLGSPVEYNSFYDLDYWEYYFTVFSFDSRNIFYVGNRLWRKETGAYTSYMMLPQNKYLTDKKYLAADPNTYMLFVAADNNIYKVSFDGNTVENLTPNDPDTLMCPAISADKRYLTFIRSGKINRLDLQTGQRLEINNVPGAEYAIYRSDLDEYFYFTEFKSNLRELYRCSSDGSEITLIKQTRGMDGKFTVSLDGIRFAMLDQKDGQTGTKADLWVWNSNTNQSFEIARTEAFAFSPSGNELFYSHNPYGSANLYRLKLSNHTTDLLFDGILSPERYYSSIWVITPRGSGDYVNFSGLTVKYDSDLD